MAESDFFGIATGNKMGDKFERTGMHAVRSAKVDAPIIEEYPLTLECEVIIDDEESGWHRVIGKIVGVLCDEDSSTKRAVPISPSSTSLPSPASLSGLLRHGRKGRPGMECRRGADERLGFLTICMHGGRLSQGPGRSHLRLFPVYSACARL